MARLQHKGAYVVADSETFGPLGGTFNPDTTSQATLYNGGAAGNGLSLFVKLVNALRTGFANANLATLTGAVTAEAQAANTVYVQPLIATGGTLATVLAAFTSTYVQAEWVAVYALVAQFRTLLLNAGLAEPTIARTMYSTGRHSRWVQKTTWIGGLAPAAATSPGASYTKSEIDKLVAILEWARKVVVHVGLGYDNPRLASMSVFNNGGSTEQQNLVLDLALTTTLDVDVPDAGQKDANGVAMASPAATTCFSTNPLVATFTRVDTNNYTVTAVGLGECDLYFGVAGNTRLRRVHVNVIDGLVPASLVLDVTTQALSLGGTNTHQLTWTVKNGSGATIAAYTNSNTYVTFLSGNAAKYTVSAAGLLTGVATTGALAMVATLSQTFTDKAGHSYTITKTASVAVTVTA